MILRVMLLALMMPTVALSQELPTNKPDAPAKSPVLPTPGVPPNPKVPEDAVRRAEISQRVAIEHERAFVQAYTELRKQLDDRGQWSPQTELRTIAQFQEVLKILKQLPARFSGREAEILAKFRVYSESAKKLPGDLQTAAKQLRVEADSQTVEELRDHYAQLAASFEKIAAAKLKQAELIPAREKELTWGLSYVSGLDRLLGRFEAGLRVLENAAAGGANVDAEIKELAGAVIKIDQTLRALADFATKLEEKPIEPGGKAAPAPNN